MPKREDIKKILVIGSGPIVIGQAAEFDYAGTQACLSLKEEGYEVILCNCNPATIMTDTAMADKVYMEPLTLPYLTKIIRYEKPDALLSGIGGQTGLNLAMELSDAGVLAACGVELLGVNKSAIERAEDRDQFKELCLSLGEPVLPSAIAKSMEEGVSAARKIGYPVVLRPAYTLGGTGGGFAESEEEFYPLMKRALAASMAGQVLIEKSVRGYKEIEYEVMRDKKDTAIVVCNMENIDPVGIHTGDSMVVCPSQTLNNKEYQMLRSSALKIIRALGIEGGCNVQFALDPHSFQYYLIEVNPRVSRSSALASKASGYPIARVSAKIGVGMTLDEIMLSNTPASFEPALDYVVTKLPRFPFDKFADADTLLGTQMKATGEVMSVGRTLEESFLKAVRSLETGHSHLWDERFENTEREALRRYVAEAHADRMYAIAALLRKGDRPEAIAALTGIDVFFIRKFERITAIEEPLRRRKFDAALLAEAKAKGFADVEIARFWGVSEEEVFSFRKHCGLRPVYKMIDSCASEFDSYIPYFYSTYESENESVRSDKKKILVLGSGPIRIGQGIEFDYSTVHAVMTIHRAGYEAIIINNNPETVSTDYTAADKLYFEPLTVEDVMNVIDFERPEGVIVTLGGQTAVNLARDLAGRGAVIIGTGADAIEKAENREAFEKLLYALDIPQPAGCAVTSASEGLLAARKIGYPVLVRPSFVLGGRAMQIVAKEEVLARYLKEAVSLRPKTPVLVDKYISGKEVEVDAVCDGRSVFVPGIMELVERTGVHSGDSISVYPPYSLSDAVKNTLIDYTVRLGRGLGIQGPFNIQFIVDKEGKVYIIEVNPRSSRSVPFLSKATGWPLSDIATEVMLGKSLQELGIFKPYPKEKARFYVKAPTFSFSKLHGMDTYLSPEMKSTGEAIGYDKTLHRAMYKALIASGLSLPSHGTVLLTLADEDKEEALPLAKRFRALGFSIEATTGTAAFLLSCGIKAHICRKISEGSEDILSALHSGRISYVVNTRAVLSGVHYEDGAIIRRCAIENNVTMLTSLDTVRALLSVLEEITIGVHTIDEKN